MAIPSMADKNPKVVPEEKITPKTVEIQPYRFLDQQPTGIESEQTTWTRIVNMTKHQTQQSKDSIDQILQEIDNILETPSFADAEILNRYFSK